MSKRTLLLADDSVTIQKVVNLTFADEGIDVITVGDGDSAIKQISESRPDVVLADVHMPGLSGYQICEIVRENPATRELPVVLLVGSFEPFDENEAARVGANAFLTKPFQSIRQLVSQVSDLMELRTARPPEPEMPESFEAEEPSVPDTTDIESLYKQSFGEAPADTEGESGPPRFVDAGMDDEMIEAVHSADELEPASAAEPAYTGESEEMSGYADTVPDANVANIGLSAASPDAGHDFRYESPAETPAPEDDTSESAVEEDYFDQFAATEQIPTTFDIPEPDETLTAATARPTQENFRLDDIDLLELPPLDNGKTLEFGTKQEIVDQGGTKQVMSLSPELMEKIVQKVVDKLSNKE